MIDNSEDAKLRQQVKKLTDEVNRLKGCIACKAILVKELASRLKYHDRPK